MLISTLYYAKGTEVMDEMTNMADNPAARLAEVEETLRQALAAFQPKDDVLAFSFEDIFQLFLYHKIFAPKKPVEPCPIQFSRLYRLKGRLLAEAGDYAGAAGALTEALTWNPVDPEAVFELAEVHKLRKNIQAFLDETRRAFGLAVTREQLARGYRNWGYYFIEKGRYDQAAQLYFFSNAFSSHDLVLNELLYINQMTGKDVPSPDQDKLLAILERYKIPLGPSDTVVDTALALADQSEAEGEAELAHQCRQMAFDLTGDPKIKEKLN